MSDPTSAGRGCPYQGLIPFEEKDAKFFFGREPETEVVLANLRGNRLTVVYGASGVGKSSVLRAGVAHRFHQQAAARRALPESALVLFRGWSGDHPSRRLLAAVAGAVRDVRPGLPDGAVDPSLPLDEALDAWTACLGTGLRPKGTLLLILDQFEEYFLYHPDEQGSGSLAEQLPRVVGRADLRVNLILSLRDDALARLDRFKAAIPNLFDNTLRIDHLGRDAARQAVLRPLEVYRGSPSAAGKPVEIDPDLVEAVLSEVATGKVVVGATGLGTTSDAVGATPDAVSVETPFLQLVLTKLWEAEVEGHSGRMTLSTLARLGSAERIVRSHLADAVAQLAPEERDVAVDVLRYLVTPSGAKIAQDAAALAIWTKRPAGAVTAVLERLGGQEFRILRKLAGQDDRFEIYHDVLGKAIGEYVGRAEAERQQADERARLDVQKKREQEEIRRAYEARQRRLLLGGVLVASVLAVTALAFAWQSSTLAAKNFILAERAKDAARAEAEAAREAKVAAEEAKRQNRLYERQLGVSLSRKLAAAALSQVDRRLDLALLLAVKACDSTETPTFEARRSLTVAALVSPHLHSYLYGQTSAVLALRFGGDGRTLASVGADRSLYRWDPSADSPAGTKVLAPGGSQAFGAALSSDGRTLAINPLAPGEPGDRTVQLRDAGTGRDLPGVPLPRGWDWISPPSNLAFSPDGKTLAVWGAEMRGQAYEPRVILWDVGAGKRRHTLAPAGLGYTATSVAFSPDGTRVAVGDERGQITLWDAVKGEPIGAFRTSGRSGPELIRRVAFRPDERPSNPTGGAIACLTFRRDGRVLASGNLGDDVILWDVAGRTPIRTSWYGRSQAGKSPTFNGTANGPAAGPAQGANNALFPMFYQDLMSVFGRRGVTGLVFTPEGDFLVSGHADHSVNLLEPGSGTSIDSPLTGHAAAVTSLDVAPDGKTFATGAADGQVLVWSVRRPDSLDGSTGIGPVRDPERDPSLAFSRDGRRLAYFTEGFTALQVHVTDRPQSPPLLFRVPDQQGKPVPTDRRAVLEFLNLKLSDDGTKVATGDRGGAHIWDTATGKLLAGLPTESSVLSLDLDHDAGRLFTRNSLGEVAAWDIGRRGRIATFGRYGMQGPLALARNGSRLAIGEDNLVLVFAPERPEAPPTTLKGHSGPVTCLALSADGTRLVSGSEDGTARLWDLEPGLVRRTLTVHKRAVLALWLSDDARQLLTGGADGMVVNWDLTSGGMIAGYPGTSEVYSLSTFPAAVNPHLLAISTNRGCDVWDLEVGQTLIHLGTDRPTIAAFDPAAAQPTLAWGVTGQSVYLRDFGADALKRGARRVANRDLSAEEFERYTRDEVPPAPTPPRPTPKADRDMTRHPPSKA